MNNIEHFYKIKKIFFINIVIGLSSPEFKLVDYPTVDEPNSNVMLKSSDRMKQEKNESC